MLKDATEAEIMAQARQPGLREAGRSPAAFRAIVEDFNLSDRFEGRRILDLGPGHFDFGEIVAAYGGEVVGADNDPAVLRLGQYRGYETHELDIRTLDPASIPGSFDGVFVRGSVNAMWFDDEEAHLAWADRLGSLILKDGWGWLAPWNYPQGDGEPDRQRYFELVYTQFQGLARNGFLALHLPRARAVRYGLWDGGLLGEGETLFVRNLTLNEELLQYLVTRSDFEGFLAATGRTEASTTPPAEQESVTTAGDRIIADFGLAAHCAGGRVLSIGASNFELARAALEAGASEVVLIDRNPELVKKAADMGFTAHDLNPRELLGSQELGEYDVVLCRGAINAFWFGVRHPEHERWVASLASLVRPGGVAWITPWNGVGQPTALTEDDRREIVETQLSAFLAAGFVAHELDRRASSLYDVSGDVDNLVLFTKGLDADAALGADLRLAAPSGAGRNRPSRVQRHAPSTVSRPVPDVRPRGAAPEVPIEYHTGLLDLLAANRDVFNVITYDDLPWGEDRDHEASYPTEWESWHKQVREDRDQRIHVLIQHDVDAYPELTNGLVSYEAEVGVPATIMIFRRQHDRQLLANEGRVEFRPYGIDIPLLQQLQRNAGFVIGYHANCMEHALWDQSTAERFFVEDVEILREHFLIRYFSPHGGIPKDRVNNTSLQIPAELRDSLRWVHNRYAPKFDGYWSDSGYGRKLPGDLREFVRTWQPGRRYRILTHPQHYGIDAVNRGLQIDWYQDLFRAYDEGQRQFWDDVWPDALS